MEEPRSHRLLPLCEGNTGSPPFLCRAWGQGPLIVLMWSTGAGGVTVWGHRSESLLAVSASGASHMLLTMLKMHDISKKTHDLIPA